MLDFCLIYGAKNAPIGEHVLARFCDTPRHECLFEYNESRYILSSHKDRLAVFCAARTIADHINYAPAEKTYNFIEGSLIQHGKIVDTIGLLSPIIQARQDHLHVQGNYCFGTFSEQGKNLVHASALGVNPLFFAHNELLTVISNNPHMAALAIREEGGKASVNTMALAWVISCGYIADLSTPYEHVYRVPNNSGLRINADNTIQFYTLCNDLYEPRQHEEWHNSFDNAHYQMSENIVALAKSDAPRKTGQITGGFDSRMILALAAEADVHKDFHFSVIGHNHHPDVRAALAICKALGIELEVRNPIPEVFDPVAYASSVKSLVFFSAGLRELSEVWGIGIEQTLGRTLYGSNIRPIASLEGVGGEFYRGYYSISIKSRIKNNLSYRGNEHNFRMNELFRYKNLIQSCVFERMVNTFENIFKASCPTLFDIDKLFCMARMPQFHGGLFRRTAMRNYHCLPAFNTLMHSVAFNGSPDARAACHINFKLIEKACPSLLKIPFAEKTWDAFNYENRLDANEFQAIKPYLNEGKIPGPALSTATMKLQAVRQYALEPNERVYEILNRQKYAAFVSEKLDGDDLIAHFYLLNVVGFSLVCDMIEGNAMMSGCAQSPSMPLCKEHISISRHIYTHDIFHHSLYTVDEVYHQNLMTLTSKTKQTWSKCIADFTHSQTPYLDRYRS